MQWTGKRKLKNDGNDIDDVIFRDSVDERFVDIGTGENCGKFWKVQCDKRRKRIYLSGNGFSVDWRNSPEQWFKIDGIQYHENVSFHILQKTLIQLCAIN